MTQKNDGGPAFPHQKEDGSPYWGMSLRDYFAGQALVGLFGNPPTRSTIEASRNAMAAEAYSLADAMIAAREAKP